MNNTYCTRCLHVEDDHKWYAQDEINWDGVEHWECRALNCSCEVNWTNHDFTATTQNNVTGSEGVDVAKQCKAIDCKNKRDCKGYCTKHYGRLYTGIDLYAPTIRDKRPAIIEGDIAKLPLNLNAQKGYAIVDANNAHLDKHNWYKTRGYPHATIDHKAVPLHRLVMGNPPEGMFIDHIDGNPLDNRLSNLRFATFAQNARNRGTISGKKYKGTKLENSGRWRAVITANNKRLYLGMFNTEDEAAEAYNRAAIEHHGEYARLNVINRHLEGLK